MIVVKVSVVAHGRERELAIQLDDLSPTARNMIDHLFARARRHIDEVGRLSLVPNTPGNNGAA